MNVNGSLGQTRLGVMTVALSVCVMHASTEVPGAPPVSATVAQHEAAKSSSQHESRLARLLREASFSPGVSDVVRMTKSGTGTSVLIAHIQASEHAYKLRSEDIVHLEENEVPDSVIASMIVRGAEVRSKVPPAPALVQPVQQQPQTAVSATVNFVTMPTRRPSPPRSTVTVIGRSHGTRGLSYRNHFYSARNFYAGTYGRVYPGHGGYSFYGSSDRRGGGHHRW